MSKDMSSGSALGNLLVGLVFLGSLAILGFATLSMSTLPFFRKVEALEVRFPSIDSLRAGDDVLLHGFRVGQVDDIKYDPGKYPSTPILVRISVRSEVMDSVTDDTEFSIRSAGRYLEINPPEPEEAKAPPGKPGAAAEKPIRTGKAPGDLFGQLQSLVEKNEQTITDTLATIRRIAQNIESGQGLVGRVINDPILASEFADAVVEIRTLFAGLNAGEGPAGLILKDAEAKEKIALAISDITDAAADLREIARKANQGEGLVAELVNNPEMATDAKNVFADVHELIHKVNEGQGTLGQLVNNPRAWEELLKILVLARETIEDMREQAPISTFVNALFATF
jgi:phospholipid/cholesterol/gamma-HCH transport system substrate-binding protein